MKINRGHILTMLLVAYIIIVCLDADASHLPAYNNENLIREYAIINFSDLLNDDRIQDLSSSIDLHIIARIALDSPTEPIGESNLPLAISGFYESVWSLLDLPPPYITI